MAEHYVAWCRVCDTVRYRSIRELDKSDKVTAADFQSVGDQPSPDQYEGQAITCYSCGKGLVFFPESTLKPKGSTLAEPPVRTAERLARGGTPAAAGTPIRVLFEVSGDERIVHSGMVAGSGYMIVTSKRVILVEV